LLLLCLHFPSLDSIDCFVAPAWGVLTSMLTVITVNSQADSLMTFPSSTWANYDLDVLFILNAGLFEGGIRYVQVIILPHSVSALFHLLPAVRLYSLTFLPVALVPFIPQGGIFDRTVPVPCFPAASSPSPADSSCSTIQVFVDPYMGFFFFPRAHFMRFWGVCFWVLVLGWLVLWGFLARVDSSLLSF